MLIIILLGSQYCTLSVTFHINCIVARRPDKRKLSHVMYLYQVTLSGHDDVKLFERSCQ